MTLLVRIIAKHPVQYSLDNGITVTEYAPGEVYSVPEFAGVNMVRRGWAERVEAVDLADEKPKVEFDEPLDLAELRRTTTEEEPKR